jgi:hypothetical protein
MVYVMGFDIEFVIQFVILIQQLINSHSFFQMIFKIKVKCFSLKFVHSHVYNWNIRSLMEESKCSIM